MQTEFATAMRRALGATRAMKPEEATAIIQTALAGQPVAEPAPTRAPVRFSLIDPDADTAEVMDDEPASGKQARPPQPKPIRGPKPPFSVLDPKADRGRRTSLRQVVEGLVKGRPGGPLPGMRPSRPPAVPDGAQYEWRSHRGPHGSRDYRLYVPATLPDGPQGLILMLHGCTQNPDDFATGTAMNELAERHGLILAYPAQISQHNPSACWNWFRPGDQRREAGEPAILAGLTRALVIEFGVPKGRVFVAGLSAGGAMAAVLATAYPDLYAAAAVHSGLPVGSAHDIPSAFAAMRGEGATPAPAAAAVRTIVFHGQADTTVHPSNARRIVHPAGRPERGTAGGRAYTRHNGSGSELWLIEGTGHAWSGGSSDGSYTDPAGPDASAEMVRFFLNGDSK